jgi:hypothetical protein
VEARGEMNTRRFLFFVFPEQEREEMFNTGLDRARREEARETERRREEEGNWGRRRKEGVFSQMVGVTHLTVLWDPLLLAQPSYHCFRTQPLNGQIFILLLIAK